jgi:1,4-dihydroxy-2-naphthoyl-CoA synthase
VREVAAILPAAAAAAVRGGTVGAGSPGQLNSDSTKAAERKRRERTQAGVFSFVFSFSLRRRHRRRKDDETAKKEVFLCK